MDSGGHSPSQKILVVDDDPLIRFLVSDFIAGQGFHPVPCPHPQDALKVVDKWRFFLAFVDINLPHMNGLDLAARLKQMDPGLEIVFMTGHGTFENAIQAIKIGAYDYLRKPFGLDDLSLCLKRFQQREALREKARLAEKRYLKLVENIPSMVFVVRPDFSLDFLSRASKWMLGYSPEEALARSGWFLERIHPEDLNRIKSIFLSAFSAPGSRFSVECRLLHRRGHIVNALIHTISTLEPSEEAPQSRLEGVIIDISERVFSEKAAVQREKLALLGTVSAEVAHEIRNPLTAIGGFAKRLQRSHPELDEARVILRESQRLEQMLGRIMAYLKPEETSPGPCDIREAVLASLSRLEEEIAEGGSRVKVEETPDLPPVFVDGDLLQDLFSAIIRQAVLGVPSVGELLIRTYESENHVHAEFSLISPDPLSRPLNLFPLPFNEPDHWAPLARAHRLLKEMGGILSCEEGKGSVSVTVSLPKGVKAP
ncbi:MAG: response regulator [Deltaproteobacteria bacterium]|nr:response regulator [Deltaproteobacteria bacterium]